MAAQAIARFIRMSPRKVRLVANQIRGRSVNDAYAILQFSKKAAARPFGKTLRSAVANAQQKGEAQGESVDVDKLVISEVFVNEGPTLRRYKAAAQGRPSPRRHRMSHITVVVDTRE